MKNIFSYILIEFEQKCFQVQSLWTRVQQVRLKKKKKKEKSQIVNTYVYSIRTHRDLSMCIRENFLDPSHGTDPDLSKDHRSTVRHSFYLDVYCERSVSAGLRVSVYIFLNTAPKICSNIDNRLSSASCISMFAIYENGAMSQS